jgi:magnesium transporter
VVDSNHVLLGILPLDDVIDIVKEEATEDIYNLAGLSEMDRAATPMRIKVKKRLPWMLFNLFSAGLASAVVSFFQESIENYVILAVFMPIVAGIGGNSAIQSLTVITRAIALGELKFVKAYKAIGREVGNGLVLGLISGLIMALIGFYWQNLPELGFVLFLALILNLVAGGFIGATIPIIFRHLGLDPAVGTSVLVTMVTDVCGFLFFLGLARLWLPVH